MDRSRSPVYLGTAVTVGAVSIFLLWRQQQRKHLASVKEYHIQYSRPKLPLAMKIIAALPDFIRRPLLIKGADPKPPMDVVDILGESNTSNYDPYETIEIEKNRVWRVKYKFLFAIEIVEMLPIFGMKVLDPMAIDRAPAHMKERIAADRKTVASLLEESKKLGKEATQKKFAEEDLYNHQYMIVTRMETGGLLLFNPVRMRPQLVQWLNSLGTVEWIISGASSHTNHLPEAAETFPKAKVVCARVAEEKCTAVGMRRADFLCTNPQDLREVNRILKDQTNAYLFYVKGDNFTHALCVLIYGHLFTIDLTYGHYNGERFVWSKDQNDFENGDTLGHKFTRLLFYGGCYKDASVTGYVPNHRHLGMDPFNTFSTRLCLDPPKEDGSSCTDMANSLRELLKLDFKVAVDGHGGHMTGDEFRKTIDASWNWLDGDSLLSS